MRPHRTFIYYFYKLRRLNGDPAFLARGVFIGLFIAATPTLPLHTIVIIFAAILFRASKISALLAAIILSNPLTFFIQYYLAWLIGNFFMPGELSWAKIRNVLDIITADVGFQQSLCVVGQLGIKAISVMLIGGIVLAVPISIAGYFISFNFFLKIHKRRLQRQLNPKNDDQ